MFIEIKPINLSYLLINHASASITHLEKWHCVFYDRQQEQLKSTCAALPATDSAMEDEKLFFGVG